MALDSLQRVIEKLQKTIEAHRGYLAEDETRTRQVLIDPLLRKLGWDVSNPNVVQLEYRVGELRADYALMAKGQPVAVIEAKSLGSNLKDRDMGQAFGYASMASISYAIVTDGDKWEMYEVFKRTKLLEEKLLMQLELSQQPAHKNALQALAMRKPNLTAKKPDFKLPKRASKRDKLPKPSKPLGRKSYSFDSGKKYPQHTKPSRLKIGNYVDVRVNFWRDVIHEVVVWLVNEGRLNDNHCPIETGKWTFVSSEAVNRDGTPFKNPRQLPKGFILHRGLTTEEQWSGLRKMLDQLQVDTSAIQVSYRPTGKASR